MTMKLRVVLLLVGVFLLSHVRIAAAFDFFFLPDTSRGNMGDTVTVTGRIGPSDTLRSFTVYLFYDTNAVDLVRPPLPGALIAGRAGLDFRYADHIPAAPNRLEIGATVFSTDYWAGPGELFIARFALRRCGDETMAGSPGFRRPDGSYIPGVFDPPMFLICPRVPQSPRELTIYQTTSDSLELRWNPVVFDELGRMLLVPPEYRIFRQQMLPAPLPPMLIGSTGSTVYTDAIESGDLYHYYIVTVTNE